MFSHLASVRLGKHYTGDKSGWKDAVWLKHERYCEHFLEMMLHVFIDMLSIYVNMYSLI